MFQKKLITSLLVFMILLSFLAFAEASNSTEETIPEEEIIDEEPAGDISDNETIEEINITEEPPEINQTPGNASNETQEINSTQEVEEEIPELEQDGNSTNSPIEEEIIEEIESEDNSTEQPPEPMQILGGVLSGSGSAGDS